MKTEYVLWGTKKDAESWEEELITTAAVSSEGEAKIEKAKIWAKQNGFDRLRVSKLDPSAAPDFTGAIKRAK
jgi:hypothetical protein